MVYTYKMYTYRRYMPMRFVNSITVHTHTVPVPSDPHRVTPCGKTVGRHKSTIATASNTKHSTAETIIRTLTCAQEQSPNWNPNFLPSAGNYQFPGDVTRDLSKRPKRERSEPTTPNYFPGIFPELLAGQLLCALEKGIPDQPQLVRFVFDWRSSGSTEARKVDGYF